VSCVIIKPRAFAEDCPAVYCFFVTVLAGKIVMLTIER